MEKPFPMRLNQVAQEPTWTQPKIQVNLDYQFFKPYLGMVGVALDSPLYRNSFLSAEKRFWFPL